MPDQERRGQASVDRHAQRHDKRLSAAHQGALAIGRVDGDPTARSHGTILGGGGGEGGDVGRSLSTGARRCIYGACLVSACGNNIPGAAVPKPASLAGTSEDDTSPFRLEYPPALVSSSWAILSRCPWGGGAHEEGHVRTLRPTSSSSCGGKAALARDSALGRGGGRGHTGDGILREDILLHHRGGENCVAPARYLPPRAVSPRDREEVQRDGAIVCSCLLCRRFSSRRPRCTLGERAGFLRRPARSSDVRARHEILIAGCNFDRRTEPLRGCRRRRRRAVDACAPPA